MSLPPILYRSGQMETCHVPPECLELKPKQGSSVSVSRIIDIHNANPNVLDSGFFRLYAWGLLAVVGCLKECGFP